MSVFWNVFFSLNSQSVVLRL
uniref:Uncharacterized protein n=1 Tax=Anguilla anguilla TaxID=7936 RepID=A0A0E9QHR1_ANGAN